MNEEDVEHVYDTVKTRGLLKGANKWGTFIERVKWIINTTFQGVALIVLGIVKSFIWICLKSYGFMIFLYYGGRLWVARYLALWLSGKLAFASGFLATIIDAVIKFLSIEVNGAIIAINGLISFINKDIIGLINSIAKFLRKHTVSTIHFQLGLWKHVPNVSSSQVKTFLTTLPRTCEQFDNGWDILRYLVRLTSHSVFCDVTRYFYPLEHKYNTHFFPTVFGTFYAGSADPILNNTNANCLGMDPKNPIDSEMEKSLDTSCILLGICYLFLDIFIGILLVRAIAPNIYDGVMCFWELFTYGFVVFINDSEEILVSVIKAVLLL